MPTLFEMAESPPVKKEGLSLFEMAETPAGAPEQPQPIPTLAEGDEWLGPQRRIAQTIADWKERLVERPADIVKWREQSGLDYGEIFSAYDAVDNDPLAVGPYRKERVKKEIDRRRYKGFFNELDIALTRGGENVFAGLTGTLAMLQRANTPYGWYPHTPEVEAMSQQAAERNEAWAKRLHEDAQSWSMQPGKGGGFRAFVANSVGETLPFMATTVAAGAVGGPVAAFGVAAAVEGDNAYRDAIADGATEEQAGFERLVVGTINGVIELAQVGEVLKLGKRAGGPVLKEFTDAVVERSLTKFAKATGKITLLQVQTAINEGFEEVAQEWVSMGAAVVVHGKDISPQEFEQRTLQAGAGGATAGFLLGGGSVVLHGTLAQQTEVEEPGRKIPYAADKPVPVKLRTLDEAAEARGLKDFPEEQRPPMVMSEEQHEQYEAQIEQIAKDAEAAQKAEKAPAAQTAEEAPAAEGKQPWEMTAGEQLVGILPNQWAIKAHEAPNYALRQQLWQPEDIWYHGTQAEFKDFKAKGIARGTTDIISRLGIHFTEHRGVAERFAEGLYGKEGVPGRVVTARLHIVNPAAYNLETDLRDAMAQYAVNAGIVSHSGAKGDSIVDYSEGSDVLSRLKGAARTKMVRGFIQSLQDKGYDGIVYGNAIEGFFGNRTAIAFSPEQIEQVAEPVAHIQQVQQAVSEGKPVPREVLDEYKGQPWADEALAKQPAAEGKEGRTMPGMETAGGSPTEIVKPNLYIGNVTGRMKREWAEILGVDPEEIGPYTEKGWPTKRTEIPLTRAMATDYLARAEEHLEALIGHDLIKTENDLAAANALYGDIKELRAKLGLNRAESLITRHAPKYEAVEIENVRQRIKEAIEGLSKQTLAKHEPKKLVTRGEALTAAMRKAQKESLQAWYSGRRQLRTQLREKAAIKKRKQKALQTIKREIPASVDVVYAEAIRDLKKAIDLHGRSPGVVAERRTMQRLAEKYPEQLAGMDMKRFGKLFQKPLNEFDVEELEALADEITQLIEWGKTVRATEAALYKESKRKDLEALKAGSVPITEKEIIKPKNIGEPMTFSEKFTNTYHKIANWAKRKSLAITPMDVFFDMLDGTAGYGGPNYQLFKQALDTRHGKYLDRKDAIHKEIAELADQLGLEDGNFERIGVHAALQQENGRKKLNDSGYDDAMIDAVTLSPEEMQLYERMRERLDELSEPIEAVMYEVYNQPMGRVKNYFSFMTDFEAMSDFEVREFFGEKPMEYGLRKNVQRGFTVTRTGGKQKIKINAMEIFLQHTDNAAYLIEMGGEIKRLAEIAASPDYAEAAGSLGRMEVLNWLDLMARKGRSQMGKVIPIVDTYRKHVGAAMLGFRLSSALVNITPLLDGTGLIGQYSFSGAVNMTDKNWRQFIVDNMPEIRDRFGGDIDLLEFGSSGIQKIERMGFWPLQKIDAIATGAVAIGAYEKNLADRGLAVDLTKPDAEALRYAQQVVRRSQSSGFYKDVPAAFTRGDLTSNRSLDRLLLQFQSFMLNRWSLIRHDMIRAGIRGNPGQAVNLFIWLSIATMAEIGLRRASKELIGLLTGADTDDWSETFNRELVVNTLQNIPVVSQGVSFVAYGGVPVPLVDLAVDIGKLIQQYQRTKDPKKKEITALRTILLAGSAVSGAPGGSQAAEIVRNLGKRPSNYGKIYGKMSREELWRERKDLVYQTSGKRPDGTKYYKGETKPDKDELLKLWQEAWNKTKE